MQMPHIKSSYVQSFSVVSDTVRHAVMDKIKNSSTCHLGTCLFCTPLVAFYAFC